METYRIVPGPLYTPSALARARPYDDVTAAVTAMGEGVVVTSDGTRVVAFHEAHLPMMERLADPAA